MPEYQCSICGAVTVDQEWQDDDCTHHVRRIVYETDPDDEPENLAEDETNE